MIGFHITTLGCKLNQFDSASLSGALRTAVTPSASPADAGLVVVNTCTVTEAADADARQILRRRRRESPRALIVATGCYAERDPEALGRIPEVDLVLRRDQRERAAGIILEELRLRFPSEMADGCADRAVEETIPDFGERSRAYLRVQEGCDLRCSYCIIPAVRGESRSLSPDDAAGRFSRLLGAGFREVVLTGVNTGDYGRDLAPQSDLTRLLSRLVRIEGDFRVRLNSVEPRCVTGPLVSLMACEPKIARHLQVPLQSGSDRILRAMRRNYRVADYARVLDRLRARVDGIGLGADLIVGFPGETDADFEETMRFVRASGLSYLHVFAYSRRPGTPAATLEGQVPAEVIRTRSRRLRQLGADLSREFKLGQAGRSLRALVLRGRREDGRLRALTSSFIEVALEGAHEANSFVDVRITAVDPDGQATAEAAQPSSSTEQATTSR